MPISDDGQNKSAEADTTNTEFQTDKRDRDELNFPSRVNSSNEMYTALTKDFSLPSLGANEKLQSGNEKDHGLLSDAKEQGKEPRSIDVLQQEQTEKIAGNDFGEELAASNESEPLRKLR